MWTLRKYEEEGIEISLPLKLHKIPKVYTMFYRSMFLILLKSYIYIHFHYFGY